MIECLSWLWEYFKGPNGFLLCPYIAAILAVVIWFVDDYVIHKRPLW